VIVGARLFLATSNSKPWYEAIKFRQAGPHRPIYFTVAWLDAWIENQICEPVEVKGRKAGALPLSGFAE
jgi:hypothetical protein